MKHEDRYDSLIKYYCNLYGLDWNIIKRQIKAESNSNPKAVSSKGAKGLMQFMPSTCREYNLDDPFNPEANIEADCKYMSFIYSRFEEIPEEPERYKFVLASYNGGRFCINKVLAIARQECGQPTEFTDWIKAGRPKGPWQKWEFASRFLTRVKGENAREIFHYVRNIMIR